MTMENPTKSARAAILNFLHESMNDDSLPIEALIVTMAQLMGNTLSRYREYADKDKGMLLTADAITSIMSALKKCRDDMNIAHTSFNLPESRTLQ